MAGHWPFDGSLEDLIYSNDAVFTSTGKERYDTGIDGDAIDFTSSIVPVTISTDPNTAMYDAWTLSWWDLTGPTPGAEWESMVASGPSTGYELLESDRVSSTRYATGFNSTGTILQNRNQINQQELNAFIEQFLAGRVKINGFSVE